MTSTEFLPEVFPDIPAPQGSALVGFLEGGALIIGLATLEATGFLQISALPVHPFLFVVLLLAAQYGIYGGVLSAIASAATAIALLWNQGGLTAVEAQTIWPNILVWLAAGVAVGVLTSIKVRELNKTKTALLRATTSVRVISEHYEVLTERTHALERRLMASPRVEIVAGQRSEITSAPDPVIADKVTARRSRRDRSELSR